MAFTSENFTRIVKEKGFSNQLLLDELEKRGISLTLDTVKSYRRKKNFAIPSPKVMEALSDILNVSIDELMQNEKSYPVKMIPVLGTASCGSPDINHLQDARLVPYHGEFWHDKLYCVIANGDSMAPEIEDGDEVICDPTVTPKNGDIVHYKLYGESAIKVFFEDEDAYIVQFIPYNSNENFKTKTVRKDSDEYEDLDISVVVAINKLKFTNRKARLRLIGRG